MTKDVDAISFYGKSLQACGDQENTCRVDDDSTTAGDSDTEDQDTDEGGTSSSSEAQMTTTDVVGFFRHGVWQPRQRTAAELRQHLGGGGMQRTRKRQERMNSYLSGQWKPSWLLAYIKDKEARQLRGALPGVQEEPAEHHDQDDNVPNTTWTNSVAVNSTEYAWSDDQWGGHHWHGWINYTGGNFGNSSSSSSSTSSWSWSTDGWSYWGDVSSTSSSTTSTTVSITEMGLPNSGLCPEAREVRPGRDVDGEFGLLAITNGEIAMLQEAGVSRTFIDRLSATLDALDDQQRQGRGPESRWALARYLQRASEGIEASQAIVEVLQRRLRPRGLLPVQRVPRGETERWRIFSWIRQYVSVMLENLEQHLRTPLQPAESEPPQGDMSSENEESPGASHNEGEAPQGENLRSRSRSPSRSLSAHVSRNGSAPTSEFACNSEGEVIRVATASSSEEPRGPPPPEPVTHEPAIPSWVTLEPVGIWREMATTEGEPHEGTPTTTTSTNLAVEQDEVGNGADDASDEVDLMQQRPGEVTSMPASTSTTSTSSPWSSPSSMSLSSPSSSVCALTASPCSLLDSSPFGSTILEWDVGWRDWPLTTTTTSSQTLEMTWPSDVVRDSVNTQLVHGDLVDVVELIAGLLDRQRHLRHMDNLIRDAIEEALLWIPMPLSSTPMNANTFQRNIWGAIARESEYGSGPSSSTTSQLVTSPSVVLGAFSATVDELRQLLPDRTASTVAGYRRRAWRVHAGRLLEGQGRLPSAGSNQEREVDSDLFLTQADPTRGIAGWPAGASQPVSRRLGARNPGRRRLRGPRPPPRRQRSPPDHRERRQRPHCEDPEERGEPLPGGMGEVRRRRVRARRPWGESRRRRGDRLASAERVSRERSRSGDD